ncbi:transglycosylase SLT domain-containing protein [Acinetobacter modestus]|uniref:transglycosylase SLT domain-containing protein n=1 Tax=Acinetobacter modestus TaxID=1776740 RepID=UPI003019C05D
MRPIEYTITAVDRATQVIDRISNRVERLTQPFSRLERSVKRFGDITGINKLGKGISWLTTKMMSLLGVVLKLGAPLLALFGGGTIAGIYQMTEGWAKLGSVTERTAQIMGVSAQRLMNWRGVGDLVGIGAETMTQGLQGFQQTLQDAKWGRNQAVFGMLKMLNIDLKHTKNGVIDTEAVLYQLADRIQKVQKKDPAAAQKLAESFGVTELLPVLMNGSKALKSYQAEVKRLQGNISPAMTERASKFALSINKMKIAADSTKAAIADKLIPIFQPLIDKWTKFLALNRTKISDKIAMIAERLAKWLDKIDFDATMEGINNFIDKCGKLAKWVDTNVEKFGGWETVIKGVGIAIGIGFVANIGLAVASLVGMIAKLGIAATSVGALGTAFTWLGGVALGGVVGWGIGNVIRDQYMKTDTGQKVDNWIGEKTTKLLAFLGNDQAKETLAINERTNAITGKFAEPSGKDLLKSKLLFDSIEHKYGLPAGMADRSWWMESSRGVNMLSRAGAQGHFGFMPKTAREYGLKNPNDLIESADAYGRKMQHLLRYYKGSTPKAFAAYNYGEGKLDKLIKKYPQDWQQHLNPETAGYLRKAMSPGTGGNPTMPLSVNVITTVHPNGASTTKIATPQNVKIVHNPPGANN